MAPGLPTIGQNTRRVPWSRNGYIVTKEENGITNRYKIKGETLIKKVNDIRTGAGTTYTYSYNSRGLVKAVETMVNDGSYCLYSYDERIILSSSNISHPRENQTIRFISPQSMTPTTTASSMSPAEMGKSRRKQGYATNTIARKNSSSPSCRQNLPLPIAASSAMPIPQSLRRPAQV